MAEFELKISKANFTTWFHNTGVAEYCNGHVTICVPNTFIKSWMEKKYHLEIVKSLERITGKPIKKVEYRVENVKNIQEQECPAQPQMITNNAYTTPQMPQKSVAGQFGLNPKYKFSTFIVGKGNELAHAAAQAVAERPGDAYNPLFIYGGVGLGKTHLLQAVGNMMLEKNPNLKILYASMEKFTNEFVSAIREKQRMPEFKEKYRNIDLLLIDDVQFIGGKEGTQEEFFHTFNELHQQGKQVVLTSDRPPKAIPSLEDRLSSRFGWGMIADISAPDMETRVAILQSKCQEKGFALEANILQLIADATQSNIRDLEGALNKIIAFHQLKNMTPTKETVRSVLATLENKSIKKTSTPREIIAAVSKYFDIGIDDILGKSREKRLSFPRQIIMYILRKELKMSYPSIGSELGGRDHTTAMHAHTKISTEIEGDLKLKQDIEMIKERLYEKET